MAGPRPKEAGMGFREARPGPKEAGVGLQEAGLRRQETAYRRQDRSWLHLGGSQTLSTGPPTTGTRGWETSRPLQ